MIYKSNNFGRRLVHGAERIFFGHTVDARQWSRRRFQASFCEHLPVREACRAECADHVVRLGRERATLALCRELGIGFVPFAPLGYGFLTGAIDEQTRFAPTDYRAGTPRMSPENLPHNMALVRLLNAWAERKQTAPGQIALAWLMAQAPWIVPIPGTTQMPHMRENAGAAAVRFTPGELAELNQAVRAIEIRGARMSPTVQAWSDVEAPARRT